jgi:hypothetical protein
MKKTAEFILSEFSCRHMTKHANFEENDTNKFKVSTLNLMVKFGKVHKKSTIINQPGN